MIASEMKQALIIGGGVVGLCSAIRLQKRGFATTVIEPDFARQAASWGNAGHIAIEQVEPLASWPMLRSAPQRLFLVGGALDLPIRDATRWLPFASRMILAARRASFQRGAKALSGLQAEAMAAWRRLEEDTFPHGLFKETGHYAVWETRENATAGLARWQRADTGSARFHKAEAPELAALSAIMHNAPAGAIRFENTAQILDPVELADALQDTLEASGGRFRRARASRLAIENGVAQAILDNGETLRSDLVIVTAGVQSGTLIEPLGTSVPVIAERGYHVQTARHGWPNDLPPVVFEDRSMIVTGFKSGLRAAGFVELGRPESPPDPRKWHRLRTHIAELGLPFSGEYSDWMGARPTLPDYLPAIGRSRHARNLLYAFGHQHLGLTLAPITGELIAAIATGAPPAIDLGPFDIERFAR